MISDEPTKFTTPEKGQLHDTIAPLLSAAHKEMQELSKKKPDTTLSPNKAKILNRLLNDARNILEGETEAKYLDVIDEEATLPVHSDVVLMLSQYSAAFAVYRQRYFGWDSRKHEHCWFIK